MISLATMLALFTFVLVVSLVSSRFVRAWATRCGWVDVPKEERRVHTVGTPTTGGLAILAGIAGGLAALAVVSPVEEWLNWNVGIVLFGGLALAGAGWRDDTAGLGFKRKFLIQVLVAYLLLHAGFRLDVAGLPFVGVGTYDQALFSIPLTMLWIVGIINAVNLIDGIDGLAGGVVTIACSTLSILFLLTGQSVLAMVCLIVAGATLGFLRYNFYPASMFMGDTGSLTLGYILAVVPLAGSFHADPFIAFVIPGLVLGVPIVDTTLTIVRRSLRKQAICGPDAQHIHHRLMRQGNMRSASLTLYGMASWLGCTALMLHILPAVWGYAVLLGTTLVVIGWVRSLGYLKIQPVLRAKRIQNKQNERLQVEAQASDVSALSETSGDGSTVKSQEPLMQSAWWQA